MNLDKEYYWVVQCKNHLFHYRQNQSAGHIILLGETDALLPPPRLEAPFRAICDDCGKEYSYMPMELLRFESEPPNTFVAHPLFAGLDNL